MKRVIKPPPVGDLVAALTGSPVLSGIFIVKMTAFADAERFAGEAVSWCNVLTDRLTKRQVDVGALPHMNAVLTVHPQVLW